MIRILVGLATLGFLVAFLPGSASAQGDEINVAELFSWLTVTPPDWNRGALYAILGFVGALVTLYTLIGGAIPGTVGKAKIDRDEERLNGWYRQLEAEMKKDPVNADAVREINRSIDELRDDLRGERWRQFTVAAVFYTVLGSFFAMMFARDLVQAVLIGAGWTGILGSLGLKGDYAYRKSEKDETLEAVRDALRAIRPAAATAGVVAPAEDLDRMDHLTERIQMAQAL